MDHQPDPPETVKARLMRRFVSGVLLCIPIVVVGFCLYELYQLAIFLVDPVIEWLGDDAPWTALGLHVIGLLLVVLFIYFIGFVADLPFIANRVDRLDRLLAQFLPAKKGTPQLERQGASHRGDHLVGHRRDQHAGAKRHDQAQCAFAHVEPAADQAADNQR